jgi:hypothetical protein
VFSPRIDFARKRHEVDCLYQSADTRLVGDGGRRSDHCITARITKTLVYGFSPEQGDKPPLRAQP